MITDYRCSEKETGMTIAILKYAGVFFSSFHAAVAVTLPLARPENPFWKKENSLLSDTRNTV